MQLANLYLRQPSHHGQVVARCLNFPKFFVSNRSQAKLVMPADSLQFLNFKVQLLS